MAAFSALAGRRWRWVLAAWLLVVVAAVPFAARQSERLTAGGFAVAGSQSERVERQLARGLPPQERAVALGAVLVPGPGATGADVRRAFAQVSRAVAATPGVVLGPRAAAYAQYGAGALVGRRPIVIPFTVDVDEFHVFDVATRLRERLRLADGRQSGAVTVHLAGSGAIWAGLLAQTKSDLRTAELIAVLLLLAILLVVFGSLVAAVLPLLVAGASVLVTGAVLYWLSTRTPVNVYATNMASMVGLGVAVDYSLFVLARFRQETAAGASAEEARATAMRTAGVAVLFSGATLVVCLLALFVVQAVAVRSMAVGAILVVLVAMAATLTLLPALLRALGARAAQGRLPERSGVFARWARAVTGRPVVSLLAALCLLCLLALPVLALQVGDGVVRQLPAGSEVRVGNQAAISVLGAGRGAPIKILTPAGSEARVARLVERDREVLTTFAPTAFKDGRTAMFTAIARHDGDSQQVRDLVSRLRRALPAGTLIGGSTAAQVDFDQAVTGSLPTIVLLVGALGFLMLLGLLRAPVLAAKAVLTTLLSVAAALGVLTLVFAKGWLDWTGIVHSPGYVDAIVVPLVLVIVFGLSMDYEMLLLARIRERHQATGNTTLAVQQGLSASAGTITAAAAIMISVFAVFIATGVPVIQEIALGAATAIALDATLVRLALVPAAMTLLGDRCWWTPRGARPPAQAVGPPPQAAPPTAHSSEQRRRTSSTC